MDHSQYISVKVALVPGDIKRSFGLVSICIKIPIVQSVYYVSHTFLFLELLGYHFPLAMGLFSSRAHQNLLMTIILIAPGCDISVSPKMPLYFWRVTSRLFYPSLKDSKLLKTNIQWFIHSWFRNQSLMHTVSQAPSKSSVLAGTSFVSRLLKGIQADPL